LLHHYHHLIHCHLIDEFHHLQRFLKSNLFVNDNTGVKVK
jgi:hypothetical protein